MAEDFKILFSFENHWFFARNRMRERFLTLASIIFCIWYRMAILHKWFNWNSFTGVTVPSYSDCESCPPMRRSSRGNTFVTTTGMECPWWRTLDRIAALPISRCPWPPLMSQVFKAVKVPFTFTIITKSLAYLTVCKDEVSFNCRLGSCKIVRYWFVFSDHEFPASLPMASKWTNTWMMLMMHS